MLHYTNCVIMDILPILPHLNTTKTTLYCSPSLHVNKPEHRILKSLIHGTQPDLRLQPSLVWLLQTIVLVLLHSQETRERKQVLLNITIFMDPEPVWPLGVVGWTMPSSEEGSIFRRTIFSPNKNIPSSSRRLWTGYNWNYAF